jgi:hypothetical protein
MSSGLKLPRGFIYYPIKSNWWILLIETAITRSFFLKAGGGGDINHMNIKMKFTNYIVTYHREKYVGAVAVW